MQDTCSVKDDKNWEKVSQTTAVHSAIRQETREKQRVIKRESQENNSFTEADIDTSSESDCEYRQHTARHVLHRAKKLRSATTQDMVLIRIGDLDVHIEPNSRTSVNVMDEYQFRALKYRSKEIRELL